MEKLNDLIAQCVLKNVMFAGQLGSQAYSVQDLVHATSLATLNNMYKATKKELDSLDTDSLFKTSSSAKKTPLKLKLETIEAIFEYRQDLEKKAADKEKARKEAAERLVILSHAKDEQEIKRIKKLSKKDLEKEILEAERLART